VDRARPCFLEEGTWTLNPTDRRGGHVDNFKQPSRRAGYELVRSYDPPRA
jgi:hypothetical protein